MASGKNTGRLTVGFILVGVIQIIGGGLGLYFTASAYFGATDPQPAADVVYVVSAIVFFISLLAGLQLLRVKKSGVYLSFFTQILQLVQIHTQAFAFQFISGFYLAAGITTGDSDVSFGFHFDILASSFVFFAPAPDAGQSGFVLYLNLLALIIVFWLTRARHQVREA